MLNSFVGFILISNPFFYLFTMLLPTCSGLRLAIIISETIRKV
jgi:hypothetical protein